MINFEYARATDVADAVRQIAADPAAKFIAGGTNLIDLMKYDVERPARLIDITRLPLKTVEDTANGGLRIGALVPNSDLAYHPLIEERYPLLSSAILAGASQQLRNMASTGGNLLQRTRCLYFYDTATPCNKREPGSGCSAIDGINRINAILGTSEACIATHPSDMCVALAALDATVHVAGPAGERAIAFADFHRLPGDTPQIDTNLAPTEIIVAMELPPQGLRGQLQLSEDPRPAVLCVRAGVGRGRHGDRGWPHQGGASRAGGVAHKPWRKAEAEAALRGEAPDRTAFTRAADILLRDARGFAHNAFKIGLARRAIERTLTQAANGTPKSNPARKSGDCHEAIIGTATSRVDGHAKVTGAAKYAAEFSARRPRSWQRRHVHHRQGPDHAHRRERRLARRRRDRRAHAREPAAHGEHRQRLQGRRCAGRFAVPTALRRQRSCSAASRSRWWSPKSRRSRSSRRRWSAWTTSKNRTSPTCIVSVIKPPLWKPLPSPPRTPSLPQSRAARPSRPSLQPRCATRANITSRSSITTRWSSMPRR